MTRRPCTFKQQDITRAVRAVVAAGQHIKRVEIDKEGRIVILTGADDAAKEEQCNYNGQSNYNEWDNVK
jgi:hypothetical protein